MSMHLCLAVAFAAALVGVGAKRCPVLRASSESEKSGCYIVVLKEATTHEKFEEIVQRAVSVADDAKVHSAVEKVIKAFTVKLSPYSLEVLREVPEVDYIEEETMATGSQTTTLPWHLDRLDQVRLPLDGRYQPMGNGSGVDIYILDSGVNFDHNEFSGRAIYSGYDPVDNFYTDLPRQNGRDCYGHGTHVASLAAGKTYGVAKGARIYSVRVLNCNNFGPWSVTLDGIDHTATVIPQRNRPAVVSMSLGGDYTQSVNDAVERLISQGIPVVVSAGNSFDDACRKTPASSPSAITVAGSASNDGFYFSTNYGACVHIFAPGTSITGADHRCTSCSKILSGTSMSTPMVSGVLAMYLQKNPCLNPRELRNQVITEASMDALDLSDIPSSYREITPNRLLFLDNSTSSAFENIPHVQLVEEGGSFNFSCPHCYYNDHNDTLDLSVCNSGIGRLNGGSVLPDVNLYSEICNTQVSSRYPTDCANPACSEVVEVVNATSEWNGTVMYCVQSSSAPQCGIASMLPDQLYMYTIIVVLPRTQCFPTPYPALTTTSDPVLTTTSDPALTTISDPALTTTSDPVLTTTSDPPLTTASDPVLTTTSDPALTTTSDPALTTTSDPALTTTSDPVLTTAFIPALSCPTPSCPLSPCSCSSPTPHYRATPLSGGSSTNAPDPMCTEPPGSDAVGLKLTLLPLTLFSFLAGGLLLV